MNWELIAVWGTFLGLVGVIGFAGATLTRYGDAIADKTRLGGSWIGVVLMAAVTSLPELVTGVSSVALARVPDIACSTSSYSPLTTFFTCPDLSSPRSLPLMPFQPFPPS